MSPGRCIASDAPVKFLPSAAAQGYEGARSKKVMASIKMTKEQIAEAQKLYRDWLAKHQK